MHPPPELLAHTQTTMQSAGEGAPLPVSAPAVSTAEAPRDAAAEDGRKSPASPSMENERQIPVDPVSLRHLGMVADPDSPLSAPSVMTELVAHSSPLLPPLRRPTFVGASLPCSAVSSPVHGASSAKREEPPSPATVTAMRSLARQHSAALARYVTSPTTLSRSASRAEGRTMAPHDDDEYPHNDETDAEADGDHDFKCGVLCMFIPGFAKKKPGSPSAAAVVSGIHRQHSGARRRSSVSRMASMERFECGSWSPPPPPTATVPAVAAHVVDTDFAMEVPKISSADDTDFPIKTAFVFEGDARGVLRKSASDQFRRPESAAPVNTAFVLDGEPRGILKKSASASQRQESTPSRMSSASQRHVRFSTAAPPASCPTSPCITPRLAMARAEFNAFLEAQSA
uniref:Uncharacterized protein n=1 Tax=Avena sativa TaxID=4498 RepID=A0ACD5UGC0_AVESA